jgi:hypothetical protein
VLLPLIESNGGMEGASADTLLQVRADSARVPFNQRACCTRTAANHADVTHICLHLLWCVYTALCNLTLCCAALLRRAVQMLGPTTATTLAGLGALLIGGRLVLRRVFEVRGCTLAAHPPWQCLRQHNHLSAGIAQSVQAHLP